MLILLYRVDLLQEIPDVTVPPRHGRPRSRDVSVGREYKILFSQRTCLNFVSNSDVG